MKITILASGSRGDVQPFVALGKALKKGGAEVCLATFANYEDFARENDLGFFRIRGDVVQAATSDMTKGARDADNPLKMLRSFKTLQSLAFDLQGDMFDACLETDAVVYHPGCVIAYFAARKMGIPSILATPFPMTPTREYPALMFYNLPRAGKGFNMLSHRLFEQVMWMTSSQPVKRFWKGKFGGMPENFGSPFTRQCTERCPTVISCSEQVFAKPADWGEHIHMHGYWFLEENEGWAPPGELLDFLEEGKPPVYIGFGSVGSPAQQDELRALIAGVALQTGQRFIMATGWAGEADRLPPSKAIFTVKEIPHSWLFPRVAAAIHHGGAGTTAAAFRAGVPQIITPFGLDQLAWGKRVNELGVGPAAIPRKKLTVENLSKAINLTLTGDWIENARSLGSKIRQENGAETTAGIILEALK